MSRNHGRTGRIRSLLSCGAPASAQVHGALVSLETAGITPEQVKHIACPVMSAEQISELEQRPGMNLAISEE